MIGSFPPHPKSLSKGEGLLIVLIPHQGKGLLIVLNPLLHRIPVAQKDRDFDLCKYLGFRRVLY